MSETTAKFESLVTDYEQAIDRLYWAAKELKKLRAELQKLVEGGCTDKAAFGSIQTMSFDIRTTLEESDLDELHGTLEELGVEAGLAERV
jgi:hypothetical protein